MHKISNLFVFIFLLITTNTYADKNWIAIEPLNTNNNNTQHEATQPDINISQIQPLNQLIGNAKVIKQLIDSINSVKKPEVKSEKNWYKIEPMQSHE